MAWKGVLCSLLLLSSLAESSSRSWKSFSQNLDLQSYMLPSWPILSAGIFVMVSVVLSLFLIFEHLSIYNQPEEQKFLIGLILMVPVYAVESFLSLLNSEVAFVCEIMRDCYEAFALYCFERYLIACLGGEENTIRVMEKQVEITSSMPLLELPYEDGIVRHPFPLNCLLRHWYLGSDFYQAVKIGIVQYMIVKTICAFLAIILELFGVYGEGRFQWTCGYPYLAVVLNFSQTWALYCLIQFYTVTKEKLDPIKPLAKFLTFKSIVFLTWWQGVIVAFLFSTGYFKGHLAQELKTRIQDYIICLEMGVSAVVHLYVFPATPYQHGERCVPNVAVMDDYASLGADPDPEEVRESARLTRMNISQSDDRQRRLSLPQSVRDVVLGSSEIMADDVRYTVSHVVEPMERGIAKMNKTFHQISENMKQHEKRKMKAKDDSYLIPMQSWSNEFLDVDHGAEGSFSDGGLTRKRNHLVTRNAEFSRSKWF
ncbi:protein LAZ1 homolog 1 [Asparagus officinalis]|uniref:protein LAZ1 homolog 1 n=1 Tax=Asparagus officinalis TaxID=4686 RepID=UPI00098E606C|nr:protein LAZ1 homolog 1 [Asparagus officinalis]XP_020246730.1 protein LAZ1 homolog 1 [Asparagus officinalis]